MSQISQEELEEFNEIFNGLNVSQKSKVKSILTNYQIGKEDFADKWAFIQYNLSNNRENKQNQNTNEAVNLDIIEKIEEELSKLGQKQGKRGSYASTQGYQQITSRSKAEVSQKVQTEHQLLPHNLDIFGSLTAERKIVKDRIKKKAEEEKVNQQSKTKAGKL